MNEISTYEKDIFNLKKEIDKFRPFSSITLKSLKNWFNISFSYTSNAIEGNTFTLDEVRLLIEDGITVGGKTLKELKEIENHAKLVNLIWEGVSKDFILTEDYIKKLHKDLLNGILPENKLGRYRQENVYISGDEPDALVSYREIPARMKEFVKMANASADNSILKIAKIHYDFVKIHPFVDGNGRIARLLMNLYLLKEGFLPIIFPMVVRQDYISSLKSNKKFEDFYKFFLWQLKENLKDYLRFLKR